MEIIEAAGVPIAPSANLPANRAQRHREDVVGGARTAEIDAIVKWARETRYCESTVQTNIRSSYNTVDQIHNEEPD